MIKLTRAGKNVYVNPNLITMIMAGKVGTEIYFYGEDDYVVVDETEDTVISYLYAYKLNRSTPTGNYAGI